MLLDMTSQKRLQRYFPQKKVLLIKISFQIKNVDTLTMIIL